MRLAALILLFCLFSCKKDKDSLQSVCVAGTLYYSNPAADGTGWSIHVEGLTRPYMILESSVPANFRTNGLPVLACLKETDIRFRYPMMPAPSDFNYFGIVTIKKP